MKKTLLSAAAFATIAVSAVAIAPTTSEAIPAFARQTGAACLSCHFGTFPALGSFGRAFKEGAFTDMGDQALIEDDELSIPAQLNITLMFRPQFITSTKAGVKTNSILATQDQVMMVAGRIGEHTGAFVEIGFGNGGGFGNNQLLNSFDVGDMKLIASYFNTGFGEDAGLQLMSVWGQHGGLLNGKALTINNSMGAAANTAGVSVSAANDMGAITLGFVQPAGAGAGTNIGASWTLAPMLRAQGFFDVADMELGLGAIIVSGQNGSGAGVAKVDAKRFGLDAQLQGELSDMQFGVYADFASASKSALGGTQNVYNTSNLNARTGYSLRATLKPVHNISLMAGIGQDKADGTQDKFTIGASYELYQNAAINLVYESVKGTLKVATLLAPVTTTKTTTLDFEFLM